MGGCKCTFFKCKNNTLLARETNSIHTHFFHYPVRDKERCIEWAIYSNNMELLKLPMEKLKNKVICDKHFPETSFMNYTRSKLNKTTAIPTLFFNSDNVEIDLLTNPTDWVHQNRNETPSTEFQTSIKTEISIDESSDQITNSPLTPPPTKRMKVDKPQLLPTPKAKISEIRILNKIPAVSSIVKALPASAKYLNPKGKAEKPKTFAQTTIINSSPPPKVDNEQQYEYIVLPAMPSPSTPTVAPAVQAEPTLEVKAIMKDLTEIKSLLNEKLQQLPAAPAAAPQSPSNESNITQSHLNKIQLFNGIKRYLSPSLIALLRMEIFAAPSREYKKDEKIICSEILKLGNEVYDFFSDEWRLRLPSKEMVKGWQSEEMTDDDAS